MTESDDSWPDEISPFSPTQARMLRTYPPHTNGTSDYSIVNWFNHVDMRTAIPVGLIADAMRDAFARLAHIPFCVSVSMESVDGRMCLVDYSSAPTVIPLEVVSAKGREFGTARRELIERAQANAVFTLTSAPMFRAWLLTCRDRWEVIYVISHYLSDGFGLFALHKHLQGLLAGGYPPVHAGGYKRYALSQLSRWRPNSPLQSAAQRHWHSPFIERRINFRLPHELGARRTSALIAYSIPAARVHGGARHLLLFRLAAALFQQLGEYFETHTYVVGLPYFNRETREELALVGPCINMVFVAMNRAELAASRAELEALVRRRFFDGTVHAGYSYDRWESDFGFQFDPDVYPVSTVFLNLLPAGVKRTHSGEPNGFHGVTLESNTTNYDLFTYVVADGDSIELRGRHCVPAFPHDRVIDFFANWLRKACD